VARREPWPADLKYQARSLYERDGVQLASDVTGIPKRTLQHWSQTEQWPRPGEARNDRKHAGLRLAPDPSAPQAPAKGEVVQLGYGFARRGLLRQLGDLAGQALTTAGKELEAGHTIKARDATVVAGIALDKAELLAAKAGPDAGGHPEVAEVIVRLRELHADLQARKAAGNGHPG
jgi:hypothetical protein